MTEPAADEWSPQQIEDAERIAASHYLNLKGAEACDYAFVSEAFWYRQELVSRDAIDPYADEPDEMSDLDALRISIWQGDAYAVTIYSPGHCDMSPEYHRMRARWAASAKSRPASVFPDYEEPPF